jgi:hypothetical protein
VASWVVRDLVAEAAGRPGTRFRAVIYDPESGRLIALGADKYRPPEALAEHVRMRDKTCRFPGCRRKAQRCDVDHTVAWTGSERGGKTAQCNLRCLCRHHHRLKQSPRWRVCNIGDRTQWIAPSGHTYYTEPHDWRDT